ncbi:Brp/Blh family beta-carotene 15,15'-dioxygenase [Flavobacterium sp.]|jgi:Brp/Blh family beta-carotene 15,15'-monooxygenase|uniref:Brp/Blh family beta-carotene 15,15'-dioxygenase n=1 Tax=Flavobacterium sp. TaxID=239 RepID=UPI0037C0B469
MSKISIITSFAGLWLTSYLSDNNQLIFGFFLIFTFGILHGANDLVLIHQIENNKKTTFVKIIVSYLLIVTGSVVLFTLLPLLALLLFILVSGYHFGEQHWASLIENKTSVRKLFELIYGLFILAVLLYVNAAEASKIIFEITGLLLPLTFFTLSTVLLSILLLISTYIMTREHSDFKKNIIEQLFYLIVLVVIFKSSSLIWGFTIYFIFWHSIPSLNDQIIFLYGEYSLVNFKKYVKTAFGYWILSIIGIAVLYVWAKDLIIFDALFFSFLASITFPHALVILKMFKK